MKRVLLLGCGLVVVAGLGFWFYGRPVYFRYKEKHAVAQAKESLAVGDYRNANLSARQALAINPQNLEACQLMAQLAELAHAPQMLDWRRRVVEISPTLGNKLKLAATALVVEPPPCPVAAQTLEELAPSATNAAAYHAIAAELALKLNQVPQAENHLIAAMRLDPANELHQLNLAVLRLRSTNDALVVEARRTLERLVSSTNVAHIALQWLVSDCLARKDSSEAERFSSRLLVNRQSTLQDRLQHLSILKQAARPDFDAFLAGVQSESVTNPAAVHSVANWMSAHDLAGAALQWLTNCPANVQKEPPVPLALIDAYMATKNWSGLEAWLSDQKWGELEFVRLAALSRAEEQQQNHLAADAHWRLAVRQAGDHLGPLTSLLTMARGWGREKAREDLLWQIFERYPRERWTARELERLYANKGNTRGLNKLYGAVAARDGKDFMAKNNFAATALLLRTSLPRAHGLAEEIYRSHPTEPIVVSTYAWSLQMQGKTKDALAALEKLKADELQSTTVALYYGLLLSADNQTESAAKYFARVNLAELLPEEKELLAVARRNPNVN